jgi:5,10-methylenetetrahydromethanopterin reductase
VERGDRCLAADRKVSQLVACAVDDADPDSALQELRFTLTRYLVQQPHIGNNCGVDAGLVEKLRSLSGWPASVSELKELSQLVPLREVKRLAACGSTNSAIDHILEYADAGCDEVVLAPFGRKSLETLKALSSVLL